MILILLIVDWGESGIIYSRSEQEVQPWARQVLAQHCTQWIQKTFFFFLLELAVEPRALSMPSKGLPLSYTPAWTKEFFLGKTWALYMADSVKLTSRPSFYKVIVSLQAFTRPMKNRQETQASMALSTDPDNTAGPNTNFPQNSRVCSLNEYPY